jgi:hypothetical protein
MTTPYKYKLTKKDLKHLRSYGMVNMHGIERQMECLVKERKTSVHEPCFECKSIARKLGLPV